jgi:hypothetical protein
MTLTIVKRAKAVRGVPGPHTRGSQGFSVPLVWIQVDASIGSFFESERCRARPSREPHNVIPRELERAGIAPCAFLLSGLDQHRSTIPTATGGTARRKQVKLGAQVQSSRGRTEPLRGTRIPNYFIQPKGCVLRVLDPAVSAFERDELC